MAIGAEGGWRVLPEALTVLATAGGTAVVQAAGTDAWDGLRRRVAVWFGRGDAERESGELARLDQTASALDAGDGGSAERIRIRQEALWQARFEGLLEGLTQDERDRAAAELQSLLDAHRSSGTVVGDGGLVVGGDLNVSADNHSVAGGVVNGGVHLSSPPPPPVSSQG
ncbi:MULTISPECIES: hypothetical protein [unclassified Streptomyces]|uniref:hypothetical protein n=1 Tax=unclassified Streptomyces TaxID=2593676 RepID=UPI001925E73B|nr:MULTISPECIES: hypothetical protein [unclassified Streptomyces]